MNEGNVLFGCTLVIPACSCHSRSDGSMVAVLVGYCHTVLFVFTSTTVYPCCLSMHCATLLNASPPPLSPCYPLMFSCNRVRHLECPPQSQVKLLCIRLSNTITVVWHRSSSRMVSVFWFISVSHREPHTNVVSDAPHDLITM